jgi:hypothetical protein
MADMNVTNKKLNHIFMPQFYHALYAGVTERQRNKY